MFLVVRFSIVYQYDIVWKIFSIKIIQNSIIFFIFFQKDSLESKKGNKYAHMYIFFSFIFLFYSFDGDKKSLVLAVNFRAFMKN